MKTIKVKTVDFSPAKESIQNHFITELLKKEYNVELSDNPDLLIYSIWGKEHLNYQCTKLFYTAEPFSPNFNECDYAIGFDPIRFGSRYLRLPLSAMQITPSIQNRSMYEDIDISKKRFCNFIYSNEFTGKGAFIRKDFCRRLMQYKSVDCPGMVLHNMDTDAIPSRWNENWGQGKIDFIKNYKFTIAFENCLMEGYTTEKLIHPFLAGSIPIYYGNPMVTEEFNKEAFIDCNAFDNDFDAVIEEVKRIDKDPELTKYMILQNPVRKDYDFAWEERCLTFLTEMVENGLRQYNHTVLETPDSDINRRGTINYELYKRGIIEGLKKWKEIVIYGKGNFALKIKGFLDTWKIENVSACIVTQISDAGGSFAGLPIVSIDKWRPVTDNPLILIAVREKAQEELMENLVKRGYHNFLSVNDFLVRVIESE